MKIKNWGIFIFVVGYHVLVVALLPFFVVRFSWSALLLLAVTYAIGGLSITAGYHRLFAHRTFKAHPAFEWVVLLGSTLAMQWSALAWSFDHRRHHAHVDTDADPYSIKKGFWYAHMGWLFSHRPDLQIKHVRDLHANPRVRFQHQHYLALTVGMNVAVVLIGCLFLHPFVAFYAGFLLRLFMIHHSTWFINSLAHVWGSKTFAKELSAVDNALLAFLTFGEGYHNYHHAFAGDYRNGIRWYHFDPPKWLIWSASRLGLAKELRSFQRIRLQRILVQKDKQLLLPLLHNHWDDMAAEMRARLEEFEHGFQEKADALVALLDELQSASAVKRQWVHLEVRRLKRELRSTWKAWLSLTSFIAKRYELTHAHA